MSSSFVLRSSFVGALLFLAGCTMTLDYDLEGHVCGPNGECQEGYICNANNVCVNGTESVCKPGCGQFEECVREKCVPTCKDRACPSGMACEEGACQVRPPASSRNGNEQLGTTCTDDLQCYGTSPSSAALFCMKPFGGYGAGVCTSTCTSDADCSVDAPKCKAFRSEKGDNSLRLCVAESFAPCTLDDQCKASGLVCGVYSTGTDSSRSNIRAVSACRAPIGTSQGARPVGVDCQPDANPCVNGLCVPTGYGYRCTTQCGGDTDCSGKFQHETLASCVQVTVGGRVLDFNYPNVRALMCMPRMVSLGNPCTANTDCNADAPNCVERTGPTDKRCAPHCTDGKADRCVPGFSCQIRGADEYCLKSD